MEIWIYFVYGITIKLTYNSCRLRSPIVASIRTSMLCINTGGLFLICTHLSHHISLSLLCRKESLLYCTKKGSLSHACGRKLLNLKLQLQIQSLTSIDHQTFSSELRYRFIWTSSGGCNFWWWNQADLTVSLWDINCPSLKKAAETEAATADPNFDQHGPSNLLFWTAL